ncbi:MAG: valine--tRNA ligase [Nitrososphaerota archaeon]|nr:valine--tRNA ligase [Nitrososphaerota archaeon]
MKSWDRSLEPKIFEKWEKNGIGRFDVNSKKPLFVIDTPPPYPSGRPWHVGGASHYSEIDMIARSARMRGFEVLFPIGIDRNGLPVEIYAEKKYNVSIKTTPREKFLELCKVALDDLEQEMLQTFKLMGLSGNYENKYRTDDITYRALTQATFIQQWNSGRIYKGTRPTNYCIDCGTTIADAEIVYDELPTKLVYFKFQIDGENLNIPIASTRPELICSCQAVIVNPVDERYKSLVGKNAIVTLYGRKVPIIAHNSAKPEFGTGAVMVCSYGDYHDVQLFRELGLREIIAVGQDGRMLETAGEESQGLRVKQARNRVIEIMQKQGILEKVEEIRHRTPLCERSKTPIEIIPMDEYYLKVVDMKEDLKKIASSLKFHPEMHRTILQNWIDVALDWPISRRRFYGTEVPVWYCKDCQKPHLPNPGPYYQPWKDSPPGSPTCKSCGGKDFVGDTRTFDTWMDSSVSALYVTKYMKDPSFHSRTYPATIRPQGKDIIRTWLHYSILRCWQISGKVPWSDVWITGWGLDEKGERMSKSKGNVIDPILMLNKYGAENFRLWIASEVSVGSDYTCSEQKIASPGKFLTKLWNISRFIASFPIPDTIPPYDDISASDKWILSELSQLVSDCLSGYEDFNFFIPANRVRDFTWNVFAAHYIELAKGRAYGTGFAEKEILSARFTLHECLRTILLILAPITPFITEELWLRIYSKSSIHEQAFPPRDSWNKEYLKFEKPLFDFNSAVWNEKKSKGLSLKEPITFAVPDDLKLFAADLRAMHNLS